MGNARQLRQYEWYKKGKLHLEVRQVDESKIHHAMACRVLQEGKSKSKKFCKNNIVLDTANGQVMQDLRIKTRDGCVDGVDLIAKKWWECSFNKEEVWSPHEVSEE